MRKRSANSAEPLIDLAKNLKGPARGLYGIVSRPLESFLSVRSINRAYRQYTEGRIEHSPNFFIDALKYLRVSYQVTEEDLERIPRDGPVIIVANHPLGGLDGVVLGALLTSVRPDVRILANSLLWHIEEIRPWLIRINPFGGKQAAGQNIRGLKEAIRYLRDGHCLGTFPSGTVSHLSLRTRKVADPRWNPNTARIIRHSQATVVPLFFLGKNSAAFQLLGLFHPLLRTAMLPREFMNKSDTCLRIRIGQPIPYRKLERFESDAAMVDYIRLNTYILRKRQDEARKRWLFPMPLVRRARSAPKAAPIIEPVPSDALRAEIEALPPETVYLDAGNFVVHVVRGSELDGVMREIGRLREVTFRAVGEGTGTPCDLDHYDPYYLHLFLWDRRAGTIAGAYRMGLTDEILPARGPKGLYTTTLFKIKPKALEFFTPGIELGRSFITPQYQRKHSSLILLWRAIHRFSARHPRYSRFFGPVSITREYQNLSKDLIVQFLKNKNFDPKLAALIKPRHPPRRARLTRQEKLVLRETLQDIEDVSALVAEVELDRKGVPTLLRHYVRLSGQLLAFNIDPDFGHCLDGFIFVDFLTAPRRLVKEYMGEDGWAAFARYHHLDESDESVVPAAAS